ncbi:hypothetical protein QWY28_13260 [Nocardioides sp. SOB77]|uniref:Uncharacterized protein n=1 Tax=Nocardioides oceani TaxID=3058369 RepID=A0ABT8FGX6_9ACTN|nr:hypothetical protein [Nocardioides oceani]MDN4173923.1 hypothetical protein [Nocardioides oceani]
MPIIVNGVDVEPQLRILRSLINDPVRDDTDEQLFDNVELLDFLALEGQDVKRAAAQVLDTVADNEVLVGKAIRTQDLQTDGAKVADSLRKRATTLRAQADKADDDADGGSFQIVNPVRSPRRAPELTQHRPTRWPC